MAVVTTNLGVVTAYGDAVAAGYTGTKEQWQALMADYATVGTQAAQDAQTASTAATTATTAAQTATTKAGEASASATAAAASAASIATPDTTLTQSGKAADAKAVGDELSTIKEDLQDIEAQVQEASGIESFASQYETGYIALNTSVVNLDNTHSTTTDYRYIIVECSEGDTFSIKGKSNIPAVRALYGWIKEDRTTKIRASSIAEIADYLQITAPAEAKYLVCNTLADYDYGLGLGIPTVSRVGAIEETLESLNLLVDKDMVNGYITTTGTIASSNKGDKVSDFIPVSEGDVLNIRSWGNPASGDKIAIAVSLFDSSKTFISRPVSTEGQVDATYLKITYIVPSGVSYIRTGSRWYGKMMVTLGDFDMGYLPSSEDIVTSADIESITDGSERFRTEVGGITENTIYTEGYEDGYIAVNTSTVDVTNVHPNYDYKHIVLNVSAGDVFNIIGHSGPSTIYSLYTFLDSEGSKLAGSGVAAYDTYYTFRAPTNAVKLVSNVRTDYPYSLVKGALIGAQVKSLSNALSGKTGTLNPLICPASPKFVMHRGLSAEAPENTVPAFELAGQGGAWGIETDVYETTDGYFVLSHDNDVSRMTDGTGKITEMTYAQTQECTIDAGNNIEQYPNLKMPLLEEYLGICRRYGVVPCIELKGVSNYTALISVIRKCGMEGSSVLTFYYDVNQITEIRQLTAMPILVIGALTSDISDLIDKAQTFSDLWLSLYNTTVTKEVIEQAHQVNVPVGIWPVDNEAHSDTRFRWGVDFVVSNSITKFNH